MSEPRFLRNERHRRATLPAESPLDISDISIRVNQLSTALDHLRDEAMRQRSADPSPRHAWLAAKLQKARNDCRTLARELRDRTAIKPGPKPFYRRKMR